MGAHERGTSLMAVRRQQERSSRLPFVLAVMAAIAGIGLLWVRLPGLPVTLVALIAAGLTHPTPLLTGVEGTGASRRVVPATPAQRRALTRHIRLRALCIIGLPVVARPVQTATLAGLGGAFMAGSLTVALPSGWPDWLPTGAPWANALAVFLLVTGIERVWRMTSSTDEHGPGTPLSLLAGASRWRLAAVALGAVTGGAACAVLLPSVSYWVSSPVLACVGATLVGAACGVWATCRRSSWKGWRLREKTRRQWRPRWEMVPKEERPPVLLDHLVDGPLTVDTFRARPGRELSYYVKAANQVSAAVGGGSITRILPAPAVNGMVDPGLFRVAVLPVDADEDAVNPNLLAAFQWAGRWGQVPKVDSPPILVERRTVGPYTVDTFDAPGQASSEMLRASSRVAVGVGAGLATVVIPEHEDGRPGSIHPSRFRVTVCDPDTRVDVSTADEDEVRVTIERFLTEAADNLHQDVVALGGLELMTVDGPQVWRVEFADPGAAGHLIDLIDRVAPALLDDQTILLGETAGAVWRDPGMVEHVEDLRVAAEWTAHFTEVIKTGDTPPVAQVRYLDELEVGEVTLHRLPFASPQGKDVARDYLPLGQRLRTTIPQAPFLLVTAIAPTEGASAPGARSDKFFEVVWSEQPVASGPADLPPSPANAFRSPIDPRNSATLALAGMVDTAFRAVFRNNQAPQTVDAECLTTCAPWIWGVSIRLYGGLGVADLRKRADRIATLMCADWVRVRPNGELVELFVGARPVSAQVAPEYVRLVAELDFEQAWVAARTVTVTGEVPYMESMVPLDGNDKVTVYTFALPAGLSEADVRDGLDRISSTTGAGFLQVVAQGDPSKVMLMSAARNPLPGYASYDFEAADALVRKADGVGSALSVPWGSGVDGRPVTWKVKDTPHALVLGITGTGKTVTLLAAVYAALLAGWDVLVIDPVKGGADFAALSPWLRGLGGETTGQADAMMRAVYAEIVRRKTLIAEHGVTDADQLPDDVRPPHVLVVIDEFTSLMLVKSVRRTKTADPDVLASYEQVERENSQKASIGSLAGRVAREARSSGIHLLLGTQVLKADTIAKIPGGDLKNNLGRLLLGSPTQGERMSGLRQPEAAPVVTEAPIGRGVWEATTSAAVEMQGWFATVEDYARALAEHDMEHRDDWDIEAFMPIQETSAYTEVALASESDVEVLDELVLDDLGTIGPSEARP